MLNSQSCVCYMGILFLGLCCHLCFLRECGACVLPSKKLFWNPDRCDHYALWVKCVSRCFVLTLKIVARLERQGRGSVYRKEGSKMSQEDLISPLGIEAEKKEKSQKVIYYRAVDEN